MADSPEDFSLITIVLITIVIVIMYVMISKAIKNIFCVVTEKNEKKEQKNPKTSSNPKKSQYQGQQKKFNKKDPNTKTYKSGKHLFEHQWLVTTLKGHTSTVTDMELSPNGKFLATCAEERTIFIWYTSDWNSKCHRNVRVNVKFDNASLIRWSPDSKAFIIKRQKENLIEVYKVTKLKGVIRNVVPVMTYPRLHDDDIIGLGISANGRYIMTATNKTDIVISDLKGSVLARLDSYVAVNYSAHLSPCGRFMIISGFIPDARLWHVKFTEAGQFVKCVKIFDLKGHNAGVFDTSFDACSTKVGTISKDGSWKLFDIGGVYDAEPTLLASGTYEPEAVSRISLSPTADVIAVSSGASLSLYDAKTSKLDITINDVFAGSINRILFDAEGKYILVCGDKYVRIFHNVTGIKAIAKAAKAKLKQPRNSAALNERLRQQISNAESFLAAFNI